MRVKIVELEISEDLPTFSREMLDGYTHLQGLVRRKTVPVGYLWLNLGEEELTGETLKSEIERQLAKELRQVEAREESNPLGDNLTKEEALPLVTVVVCTRNRPDSLRRCLDSLAILDYPELDILIVDNAPSDDRARKIVEKYPQFRYVVEPKPGLDWARNRGIAEAKGEIIAYTDDDVQVDRLWIQNIVRGFALSPKVMCVTGLVAPAERETEAQQLFEHYGGFGRGFEPKIYAEATKSWWYFPLNTSLFGTGCNMAFRRRFFKLHGGFDEALDVGTLTHGAGDLDMFYRVLRAGYELSYQSEALVWHYHRREYAKLRRQLYDFGRGYYSFLTKCFWSDQAKRGTILRWGLYWYRRWFWQRLRYRPKIGRKLVIPEALGALQGPFLYPAARYKAKKIARHLK